MFFFFLLLLSQRTQGGNTQEPGPKTTNKRAQPVETPQDEGEPVPKVCFFFLSTISSWSLMFYFIYLSAHSCCSSTSFLSTSHKGPGTGCCNPDPVRRDHQCPRPIRRDYQCLRPREGCQTCLRHVMCPLFTFLTSPLVFVSLTTTYGSYLT